MTPLTIVANLLPFVPSIAKMLGASDNVATVAEKVISVAKEVTGNPTDEGAINALKSSPELMAQYQMSMMEQQTRYEELYVQDKESARRRDTEIIKAGKHNVRGNFLVGFAALLLILILGVVTFTDLNEFAKGMFTMLAGFVTNQLANAYNSEFGTLRKEDENNKSILADYIRTPPIVNKEK